MTDEQWKERTGNLFTVAVIGNYLPEASNPIRAQLTNVMLKAKALASKSKKPVTLVMSSTPSGLGAMAQRTFKSLRLPFITVDDVTEDQLNSIDLVLVIELDPSPSFPDQFKDRLSEEFDQATASWSGNDRKYEMKVKVTKNDVKPSYDLNKPTMVRDTPKNDKRLDYGPFEKVDQFLEKVIQVVEPTVTRDNVPPHGPDVQSDTSRSGGLQYQ